MTTKYVRLSPNERVYGQKGLLQSQLASLSLKKHFQFYTLLRKEELLLKIKLKNKVKETLDSLSLLDKVLPRAHIKLESVEHEIQRKEKEKKDEIESLSLEAELNKIKLKLETLQ